MATNVTNPANIDVQRYFAHFIGTYEGDIAGLWYQDILKVYDTDSITSDFPGIEPQAGLVSFNTTGRSVKTPNDFKVTVSKSTYEDNVTIQRTYYEADKLGLLGDKVADMAEAARYQWNQLAMGLLVNGDTNLAYDGVPFFSASHPNAAGTTISNLIKTPGASGNGTSASWAVVASSAKEPTVTEAANIVANGVGYLQSLLGFNGLPVHGGMRKVLVLTGDYLTAASFLSVLSMTTIPTTGSGIETNPIVGFKAKGFEIDAQYVPGLPAGKVYLLRTDSRTKPFIGVETADSFHPSFEGEDSYMANEYDLFRFGIKVDRGAGNGGFLNAVEVDLANS